MTSESNAAFRVERVDSGAVFRVTRRERRNALNRQIWKGLEGCLDTLEHEGARFLLITADGDEAFSAGSDLNDSALPDWSEQASRGDYVRALLFRLSQSPLFTMAAINGAAYGGGLELAMACMVRFAVRSATFAMPEIKRGVMPAYGGTQMLPSIIGRPRATEMMLTGRVLDASDAHSWGLVSYLHDNRDDMLARALALGTEVAGFSTIAYRSIARCAAASEGHAPTAASMQIEGNETRIVLSSADAQEGIAAFITKRKPQFRGC